MEHFFMIKILFGNILSNFLSFVVNILLFCGGLTQSGVWWEVRYLHCRSTVSSWSLCSVRAEVACENEDATEKNNSFTFWSYNKAMM